MILSMSGLTAQIISIEELSESDGEQMYSLYDKYYGNPGPDVFKSDLASKNHVIILRDERQNLRGFTTLSVLSLNVGGNQLRGIYSGDTIVHHDHWGDQQLAFNWIRLAGRIHAQVPEIPLYWFLIVKGHRTYRYLNVFAKQFFPCWQYKTPDYEQSVIDSFATHQFGEYYNRETGVLHFPESRGHLRKKWAIVSEQARDRPEVKYFLERNPGYHYGDELVCLTRLDTCNLKPLARRLFGSGIAQ